jgi:hypothetical protein
MTTDWAPLRRVVTFALGAAVIIDALAASSHVVAQLLVGVLLVGLVSADELIGAASYRWRRHRPAPGADPGTTYGGRTGPPIRTPPPG